MTAKKEIIQKITTTDLIIKEFQEKYKAIAESKELSAIGIENRLQAIRNEYQEKYSAAIGAILTALDTALTQLEKSWKKSTIGNLDNAGYQAGLQTALLMLKNPEIALEDAQNLVSHYVDDYSAIGAIRGVLSGREDETAQGILNSLPRDNRQRNRELLNKFKVSLESSQNNNIEHLSEFQFFGWLQFMERFEDDLTLEVDW
ncbi:hypothetical protein [Streptococcus oralis]|uniref:Uncharacterized protein n=1 Tax=Streptococcus oralis TaxID=1303 RepID=A0A139QR82_STROR|nr:hypothetical protein [Streptococcus oralis]KXU05029.1 hypothetical protein SORDD24_00956 [Streptococcus oralis]